MGEHLLWTCLLISMITIRMEIFMHMISSRCSSWTCTSFLQSSLFWCLEGIYTWSTTPSYSSRHTSHRLNSLMTIIRITPLVTPCSSLDLFSKSSYCNIEANIWYKHYLWINPISNTQYKHYSIGIDINYQHHIWGIHALSHMHQANGMYLIDWKCFFLLLIPNFILKCLLRVDFFYLVWLSIVSLSS
jgi:hypothetical protein